MLEFSLTRTSGWNIKCLSVNNSGNVMASTFFDCQVPGRGHRRFPNVLHFVTKKTEPEEANNIVRVTRSELC